MHALNPHTFSSLPIMAATSRRTFVKTLSAGLGAAALPGVAFAGAAPAILPARLRRTLPADTLGFALVGLGNYATNNLAPAFAHTTHCRLTGIVTGTPAKEAVWMERHGIPAANVYNYETYERMADNPDIDVVYVVLPNSMHAEYTIRAANAGKHVLCEKPMAISTMECAEMIAACEANERKLAIGYRLHFHPVHQAAIQWGQGAAMGPVKVVDASFGFRIGNPNQWRLKHALSGGGALQDVGVYAIQAARYTTGEEPVSITAQEIKTDPVKFREVDETIFWQMKFPSGAFANCSTSYATNFNRLYAGAERGWLTIDSAYGYGGQNARTSAGPIENPPSNMFAAQMDDFAQCVMEDRQSRVSGEEGLRDVRVIEAIYASIDAGGGEVALL